MKSAHHPKSHSRGFTLIELLVVVAVIAVLMALLMPALAKAKLTSQRLAGLAVMRNIMSMVIMYSNENDQFLPGPLSNAQYCVFVKDPLFVSYRLRDYFHIPATALDNQLVKQLAPPAFIAQYDYTKNSTTGKACYFFVNNIYPDGGGAYFKPWGGSPATYTGADALPKKYYTIPAPHRYVAIIDHDAQLKNNTGGFVGTSFLIPVPLYGDKRNAVYYDGHGEALPLNANIWYPDN